jgi:hypothetical protein
LSGLLRRARPGARGDRQGNRFSAGLDLARRKI